MAIAPPDPRAQKTPFPKVMAIGENNALKLAANVHVIPSTDVTILDALVVKINTPL